MTVDLTASQDVCQPSAHLERNETIIWLRPRPARRSPITIGKPARRALARMTKSLGLGACLTLGTASAATAPASALTAGTKVTAPVEPQIALPIPAGIDLSDVLEPKADAVTIVAMAPAEVDLADGYDPREAIEPVPAAEIENVQAQIILSGREQNPAGIPGVSVEAEQAAFESIEWIQFDGRKVPRWLVDTVLRASAVTGVDPVYMMALADKESSFLPNVKAGSSSAVGLFQFLAGTWLEIVRDFGSRHGLVTEAEAIEEVNGQLVVADETMREHILGLRRNPYLSALMAAEMMKRDRASIERKVGRTISRSEFYFAHFFGVSSASKFIQLVDGRPKQSAPSHFPAAAKANRSLFFAKAGRKTRQLTVAEVYDKIDDMIDTRLGRYEDVTALAMANLSL